MTVDWDGQIRMDPSSPYAMQRVIDIKDRYDITFACDTDHDRHGIVTRRAGLLPPNAYLAVAIYYLFQHRPKWPASAAVGKTLVSSQLIDRVTAKLGRRLYEVPVASSGLWMACSMAPWDLAAKRAPALPLSAWMAASGPPTRMASSWLCWRQRSLPGWGATLARSIANSRNEFGEPVYERIDAPATPEQKAILAKLSPEQVKLKDLAGEKIQAILTTAPGNGAAIGGLKVEAESGWFAARPSGTENIYKIYAESFRGHLSLESASRRKRRPLSAIHWQQDRQPGNKLRE